MRVTPLSHTRTRLVRMWDTQALLPQRLQAKDGSKVQAKDGNQIHNIYLLDTRVTPLSHTRTLLVRMWDTQALLIQQIKAQPEGGSKLEPLDIKAFPDKLGIKAGRLEESPTHGSAQAILAIPEGLPTRGRRRVGIGRGSDLATAPSRQRLPMTRSTSSTATKTESNGSLGSATTSPQSVLSCTTC